jgi:hypothetical protein
MCGDLDREGKKLRRRGIWQRDVSEGEIGYIWNDMDRLTASCNAESFPWCWDQPKVERLYAVKRNFWMELEFHQHFVIILIKQLRLEGPTYLPQWPSSYESGPFLLKVSNLPFFKYRWVHKPSLNLGRATQQLYAQEVIPTYNGWSALPSLGIISRTSLQYRITAKNASNKYLRTMHNGPPWNMCKCRPFSYIIVLL